MPETIALSESAVAVLRFCVGRFRAKSFGQIGI
jgi:hypothetical protein